MKDRRIQLLTGYLKLVVDWIFVRNICSLHQIHFGGKRNFSWFNLFRSFEIYENKNKLLSIKGHMHLTFYRIKYWKYLQTNIMVTF